MSTVTVSQADRSTIVELASRTPFASITHTEFVREFDRDPWGAWETAHREADLNHAAASHVKGDRCEALANAVNAVLS